MKKLLTIGLIVKDEEETLARCLDSLQPLMEALDAELIITDTGSTDGTVEIAKQYTDEVCFFPWNDDFSAARNVAVDRAKGKWFLSIDADEWFENTDEIVEFFQSGMYKKYVSASYYIRNFSDCKGENYVTSTAIRLFQITGTMRYYGAIHEYIPVLGRIRLLDCFVSHTGYVYETKELHQKKHERNLQPLLQEVKQSPHNARNLFHLMNQYATMAQWDQVLQYEKQALASVAEKRNLDFRGIIYKIIIWAQVESGRLAEADELGRAYFAASTAVCMADLDIRYLLTDGYLKMGDREKTIQSATAYFDLYDSYQNETLQSIDIFSNVILSGTTSYYLAVVQGVVGQLLHTRNYEEALSMFRLINLEELREIRCEEPFWGGLLQAVIQTGQYNHLSEWERKIDSLKEKDERENTVACLLLCVEKLYLQRNDGKVEFLAFMFRHGSPISTVVEGVDRDRYGLLLSQVLTLDPDLSLLWYQRYGGCALDTRTENLNQCLFMLSMFEQLLCGSVLELADKKALFFVYAQGLWGYVHQLYHPAIWESERIDLLPGFARFAYLVGKTDGDWPPTWELSFLKSLVKASEQYPAILPFVRECLEEKEETLEQTPENPGEEWETGQVTTEFEQLGNMVKGQIWEQIHAGKPEEALDIFRQYETLNPMDPEIVSLRRQLGLISPQDD